ncbi:hypothetical protein [Streptomyces sp. WAC06614]|uniref:hypothetical protein n=1 Tax=Streptomyces sp. WAC06614 TaxID=2487416 RepID=UPI000F7B31D4|nr:hypothetical protein [Streptomyces sp. WAC06614]RSS51086.1 hypothetical protein EF918_35640 [Streptomyces sp. WAC06614]
MPAAPEPALTRPPGRRNGRPRPVFRLPLLDDVYPFLSEDEEDDEDQEKDGDRKDGDGTADAPKDRDDRSADPDGAGPAPNPVAAPVRSPEGPDVTTQEAR